MSAIGPGSELGGFVIEAAAGRGGMGVVYKARQLRPDRIVALKVVAPELAGDEDFKRRFEGESQVAAQIEHPHVIPVYAVGEEHGVLFIAMRFIVGTDLRALIAATGRLPPMRAATIIDQVSRALDAAHAQGLVHRDVKPSNVLIATDRGGDHAYLTDFGLARHITGGDGITASGALVGTIDYIAPEQVRGERVDARTDVYSLGCMLFESLTGSVPFPSENDLAKLYAHSTAPPPSARALVPELSDALDQVVRRAMAKDPELRFPSAGDFGRAAIAAASGTQPVQPERSVASGAAAPVTQVAARPTAVEPQRRRRWPLFAGVGVVVAVVIAVAVILLTGGSSSGGDDANALAPSGDKLVQSKTAAKPDTQGNVYTAALSTPKSGDGPLTMSLFRRGDSGKRMLVERRELPSQPYEWTKRSYISDFKVFSVPGSLGGGVDLSWYVKPGDASTKTCYFSLSPGGISLDSCS